ncbi:RidA family protein [Cellulomonas humilata]|uniref:RidA family protein n=1 Tax=Cellulomonas humilata TaxID=144055 RepID=UPI0031B64B85
MDQGHRPTLTRGRTTRVALLRGAGQSASRARPAWALRLIPGRRRVPTLPTEPVATLRSTPGSAGHRSAPRSQLHAHQRLRRSATVPPIQRITTPFSYSAAVVAGDTAYLGLHRGFGMSFTEQLHDTFVGLASTLDAIGLTTADLVKVTVWLKDIADLPEMEHLFGDHFDDGEYPARMTATTEFVDADCLLMIEGIAYRSTE